MTSPQHKTNKWMTSKSKNAEAVLFTSVLAILLFRMLGAGARAQSDGKAISIKSTAATQAATGVIAGPAPAQGKSLSANGELKFVVALFRHGVRAPLKAFSEKAGLHSQKPWPDPVNDWHVCETCWGDLTPHGSQAIKALGASYGSYYSKNAWPRGFKAYLWADSDERTQETASALRDGMQPAGVVVKVESLPTGTPDPLFHPFKAMCGTPDKAQLDQIVKDINNNYQQWINSFKSPTRNNAFKDLYDILGCDNSPQDCKPPPPGKQPLSQVKNHATLSPLEEAQRPASPIKWEGQWPYASSATEAFLLEFANGMPLEKVGWGKARSIPTLLRLHEFYFNKTERGDYLPGVNGSNLVREILDQLNRAANYPPSPIHGNCPRGNADSQFVGLVGHDTNLANVGALLNVKWKFDNNKQLLRLPANDALPGGALVFELRQSAPSDYWVHIEYVTQSLAQIRDLPPLAEPLRLQTTCSDGPCDMSLPAFNQVVEKAIQNYKKFLSGCKDDQQDCH